MEAEKKYPNLENADARTLANEMVKILYRKGALDMKLYEVSEDTSLTDYHLIATGRSGTHVRALADDLDYEMGLCNVNIHGTEGVDSGNWILLDYLTVIVHIFDAASREFYNLERLQKAEHEVNITDLCTIDENADN